MELSRKRELGLGEKKAYGDATVEGRSGDVMAYVTGEKNKWECGPSIESALRKLKVSRPGLNIPFGK